MDVSASPNIQIEETESTLRGDTFWIDVDRWGVRILEEHAHREERTRCPILTEDAETVRSASRRDDFLQRKK